MAEKMYAKGDKGNKKGRLIRLYKILYHETDAKHVISTQDIIEIFAARYGMEVNRKTVKDDVATLVAAGIDVREKKAFSNEYHIEKREFSLAELKMLLDMVAVSQFISSSNTMSLTYKLSRLMSDFQADEINKHVHIDHSMKPEHDNIYSAIEVINEAIGSKKKIAFQYITYDGRKKRVLKQNGAYYHFSPYALRWDHDHYYMIGFSDKHNDISQFRVDRIYGTVELLGDETAVPEPQYYSENDYGNKVFGMMRVNQKPIRVTMECLNQHMKDVIDVFGTAVNTETKNKDKFLVKEMVYPSPNFYKWVFGFHGGIKITSPKKVMEEYKEMLRDAIRDY